ncbi:hypothetical protein [uncultured Gimesia sp.]|uniref:tetratricopeptide repeat protein n=1 Tax=uncultured Gimesia sp. TaxID=1678688 RepID=UPI002618E9C4|nr:hypothetical protein [uncultured Gimesia sp.]
MNRQSNKPHPTTNPLLLNAVIFFQLLLVVVLLNGCSKKPEAQQTNSKNGSVSDSTSRQPVAEISKTGDEIEWETPTEWALLVTQKLKKPFIRCVLLKNIAAAQFEEGEKEQALSTLQPTLELIYETEMVTVDSIKVEEAIVKLLLKMGEINLAIKVAEKFKNPNVKIAAFEEIALTLIRKGKTAQAIEEVQKLENTLYTKNAFENVADELVQEGQKELALQMVESIPEWDQKGSVLCSMAWSLYGQDHREQALIMLKHVGGMAQKIEDTATREKLLSLLAGTFARGGNYKRALELVQLIKNPEISESALEFVAVTLTTSGDLKHALEIVEKIKDPDLKLSARKDIALVIAKKTGDYEQSLTVAQAIENEDVLYSTFEGMARNLAWFGKGKETVLVIQKLKPLNNRPFFFRNIAYWLVKSGNLESAMAIVDLIESQEDQSSYLANIAHSVAESGESKNALGILQDIQIPTIKNRASANVALGLAQAGKTKDALEILSQIENVSAKVPVLVEISLALDVVGDKTKALEILSDAIEGAIQSGPKYVLMDCIMPLASDPITDKQEKDSSVVPARVMKKTFSPQEKELAQKLLRAI